MSFANVIGSLDSEIGPIFHLGSGKDSSGEISEGSDTSIELLPTGLAESKGFHNPSLVLRNLKL